MGSKDSHHIFILEGLIRDQLLLTLAAHVVFSTTDFKSFEIGNHRLKPRPELMRVKLVRSH
jgi:hypothetical protein